MSWSKLKSWSENTASNLDSLSIKYLGEDIESLFSLEEPNKNVRRTTISDIEIEWSVLKNKDGSSNLKTHNLEDSDNALITSNVSTSNLSFSLDCEISNQDEERTDKINKLFEIWKNKELVIINGVEYRENLIITSISSPVENEEHTSFSISFEEITFAKIQIKKDISNEHKTQICPVDFSGTQGTKTFETGGTYLV